MDFVNIFNVRWEPQLILTNYSYLIALEISLFTNSNCIKLYIEGESLHIETQKYLFLLYFEQSLF
jgi:hypothetical protein